MFGNKRNREIVELVSQEKESFLNVLNLIDKLLHDTNNNTHAEFIRELINKLNRNEYILFINGIKSGFMWGGAGAVWEVYIEDSLKDIEFEKSVLRLIDLMEKAKILRKENRRIKRLFERNIYDNESTN